MAPAGLYQLAERTYLTLDGEATTSELEANELLGNVGDEISLERAEALGLVRDAQAPVTTHQLAERTYLTAGGEATTDESKADTLLGNAGDLIPLERAAELGLASGEEATAPTRDEALADYARELKKLKADDVRALADKQGVSTEGTTNADQVRERLMTAYSDAYDAERAAAPADGAAGSDDPDVVDA